QAEGGRRDRNVTGFQTWALPIYVPGFSVIWFGIFGYASFDIELNGDGGLVDRLVEQGDLPGALFAFLDHYPAAFFVSVIAIILRSEERRVAYGVSASTTTE